ncbi:LysR family transcriptional regulator [Nitrosococcus oceani]|uniref:Transcriptional regulator, LysR family n=2 Tax=Nitrosococcus oceani TaxID=1229 RepID=Q3J9W4_NITOC|nr:LysR family transcriptional regulator [Nitrosococcus oceani]KFI19190.1 LysR family transcriptional regulator [Nitrosococcus oceani C-27]ABA58382.1 transcriptional regulator, LysR family [Nitrosococcus oceani ATCC 19707]EDZ67004.1 LysR substrate binding domain protein [Nitrosococcus oceani AFC27]KFI22409.1 LysR family transcriptional regulator [Nitrosococcus oceani]GEM18775.1 LysR family transcriptional regulator [Nitrosococcus oceani]
MQDLNLMAIFARVVEAGSFSEAARRMETSRSAVSKAVAKLEKNLGARLLNRSTRHLSLTESGAALVEYAARILEEAEQAEQVVSSLHAEPRGMLRVSASVAFGTLHIAPALADFVARYPDIKIDMAITDRPVDLAEEGYDMIIRVTGEPDLNLVARKLAPVYRKLCATPEYFQQHGIPQIPEDLVNHDCLDYTLSGEQGYWHFTGPEGEIAVPVSGPLRINDDDALAQAVRGGLGIALLPTFTVGKDLQEGRLQAVLSEYLPVKRYVYALYLPTRHLAAKIRVFIDFLLTRFGPEPDWDRSINVSSR